MATRRYKLNGEIYNIPEDIVKDFEADNPSATQAYKDESGIYDIPVSERDGFLKAFSGATLLDDDEDTDAGPATNPDIYTAEPSRAIATAGQDVAPDFQEAFGRFMGNHGKSSPDNSGAPAYNPHDFSPEAFSKETAQAMGLPERKPDTVKVPEASQETESPQDAPGPQESFADMAMRMGLPGWPAIPQKEDVGEKKDYRPIADSYKSTVAGLRYATGEVQNMIESALGGDTQENYRKTLDAYDKLTADAESNAILQAYAKEIAGTPERDWKRRKRIRDQYMSKLKGSTSRLALDRILDNVIRVNGNLDDMAVLFANQSPEPTIGDRRQEMAKEAMREIPEPETFLDKAGAMVATLAPYAVGVGVSLAGYPVIGAAISKATTAGLVGGAAGGAGIAARDYMDSKAEAAGTETEERDFGKETAQARGAMATTAAIEALVMKFGLGRFTSRLSRGAAKVFEGDVAAALKAGGNDVANKELERALLESYKRNRIPGTAEFLRQQAKQIVLDAATTGGTRAIGDVLQTAVPIIYEHPEDYPTLNNYLAGAGKGFVNGAIMGAFLGAETAAGKAIRLRSLRKPWVDTHGYVRLVVLTDGKGVGVFEQIDWAGNGTIKVAIGDNVVTMPLNKNTYLGGINIPLSEFEATRSQWYADAAYEAGSRMITDGRTGLLGEGGGGVPPAQGGGDATQAFVPKSPIQVKLNFEAAREAVRKAFGKDSVSKEEADQLTGPDREIADNYLEAEAGYRGMIDAARENIDAQIQIANDEIDARTNEQGFVQSATTTTGKQVYVVGGNVAFNPDGSIDYTKSDKSVVLLDVESGAKEMTDVHMLESAVEPVSAEAEKATAAEQVRNMLAERDAAAIDGKLDFAVNSVVTVLGGEDGTTPEQYTITGDNGDGTVNVVGPDGKPAMSNKAKLQEGADKYQQYTLDQAKAARLAAEQQTDADAEISSMTFAPGDEISFPDGTVGEITSEADADGRMQIDVILPDGGTRVWNLTADEIKARMTVPEEGEGSASESAFVKTSAGSSVFGNISEGLPIKAAPIKLPHGAITNPATNDGYGYVHIEARHGEEIKKAGFNSVPEFVEYVAKNFDPQNIAIGQPNKITGAPTYLLQVLGKHNNVLYIEMSADGTYWSVNSGGVFSLRYGRNKETLEPASARQDGDSVPDNALRSDTLAENKSDPNDKSSLGFNGKVTQSSSNSNSLVDFRGNPLPLRTKKLKDGTAVQVVDGDKLAADDPEAWAAWNESQPVKAVDTRQHLGNLLKATNDAIAKQNDKLEKLRRGTSQAKVEEAMDDLSDLTSYAETLKAVLANYNRQQAGDETLAGEQRAEAAAQANAQAEAGFPAIRARFAGSNKTAGLADEITLANGETISGKYMLVEADAVTASHNPAEGFAMSEGFPVDENGKTVNDRDYRNDEGAQRAVTEKAKDYDQRAFSPAPPIVSADGVVLSGNDRTMAGQLAAQNGTDGKYLDYITRYGQKYGFTPEQIAQFSHPRIVFVPDEAMDYTAQNFAKFNADYTKSQNRTEKAVKAGKVISPEALSRIATEIGMYDDINAVYANPLAVENILRTMVEDGFIGREQLEAMRDGERLSGTGMDIVESALVGSVLEEEAVRIVMSDPSMRKAVVSAIGQITANSALVPEYNLKSEMADAIALVKRAKENGIKVGETVQDYIRQLDLFGDNPVTEATVQLMADILNSRRTSDLKKMLSLYNGRAVNASEGVGNIFGEGQAPETKENILRDLLNHFGYGTRTTDAAELRQGAAGAEAPAATGENGREATGEIAVPSGQLRTGEGGERAGREAESAIEAARADVEPEPTEAQKKAGNYRKGHIRLDGYDITIENAKDSVRKGRDADGKEWQTTMRNDYGYLRGTEGVDGDHIDVFLSDTPEQGNVYVVDQVNPKTGEFDEHKVMYGFNSVDEAKAAYLSNYEEGWKGLGNITPVSKEEFRKWIDSSTRKTKPFAEYAGVKPLQTETGLENKTIEGSEISESSKEGDLFAEPTPEQSSVMKDLLGMSEEQVQMEVRRADVQKYIDGIKGDRDVRVSTLATVIKDLIATSTPENVIDQVRAGIKESNIDGFVLPDKRIYLIADNLPERDSARKRFVHERQHILTGRNVPQFMQDLGWERLTGILHKLAAVRDANGNIVEENTAYDFDDAGNRMSNTTLADEVISSAMEVAYSVEPEQLADALRNYGVDSEEIINFIKNINDEQYNDPLLRNARDVGRSSVYLNERAEGSRGQNERTPQGQPGQIPSQGSGLHTGRTGRAGDKQGRVSAGRKIDDYGEKIEGARKFALQEIAKRLDSVTEKSLAENPLAKVFKKPDFARLAKDGTIRDIDAQVGEAICAQILSKPKAGTKKDRAYQWRHGESKVEAWAKETAKTIQLLNDFLKGDDVRKDELVKWMAEEQYVNREADEAQAAERRRLNPGKDIPTAYTINPYWFAFHVLQNMGYTPEEGIRTKIPVISRDYSYHSVKDANGNTIETYNTSISPEEIAADVANMVKFADGKPVEIPLRWIGFKSTRHRQSDNPTSFDVVYMKNARTARSESFETREEADRRAAELTKAEGAQVVPRYDYIPTDYVLYVRDPMSGENIELPGLKFDTRDEAKAYGLDGENLESIRAGINEANAKAKNAVSSGPKERLSVAMTYGNGWGYSIIYSGPAARAYAKETGSAMVPVRTFKTRKEAEEYLSAHRDELTAHFDALEEQRRNFVYFDADHSRKGVDYRKGKDVTPEDLATAFGFRGVQFGNWTNDADRQNALNQAYDAMMDLSEVTGLSPKALSLNGELGIAFGARGSGGFAAHYEPDHIVINLTKTQGAGSLAHEWLHAIDNYFARHNGDAFGMVTAKDVQAGLRPELQEALSDLMREVHKTDYYQRSRRKSDYYGREYEVMARLFAEYVNDKLNAEGKNNSFLSRGIDESRYEAIKEIGYAFYKMLHADDIDKDGVVIPLKSYEDWKAAEGDKALGDFPYPTKAETAQLAPAIERFFKTIQEKAGDNGNILLFAKHGRNKKREEINNSIDDAFAFVTGRSIKEARQYRQKLEHDRRVEAKDIYERVLNNDFSDVTLQKIDDYIDTATPQNPFGRRISQRVPQKMERGLHGGAKTNAVDALFSRISESAVGKTGRTSPDARRAIEERKKEALKGWAIATGNWHTSVSDFTNDKEPFAKGSDSDVYKSKDDGYVIKVSKGKEKLRKFRPDIDAVNLFNHVFPSTAYKIVGYGEVDGKFVRFLKQPAVDFADATALNADERTAFMGRLGFSPVNEERTAFSNGEIVVADLQKSNIVKDASGNVSVIDADVKLHTRDIGGRYDYPDVEEDVSESPVVQEGTGDIEATGPETEVLFSKRTKPAPKKTATGYKLMRLGEDGKLYPLFIDSKAEGLEPGVWYDADSPKIADLEKLPVGFYYKIGQDGKVLLKQESKPSKAEVEQVKTGERWIGISEYDNGERNYQNVGINGGGSVSTYAMRPGWHLGSMPVMTQIGKGPERNLRDDSFVWAEVEFPMDRFDEYEKEKMQRSTKDIATHIPEDGAYIKGTSSFVTKGMDWYIAGAIRPVRILGDLEARRIIDNYNEETESALPYDYPRESGRIFNERTMRLEEPDEHDVNGDRAVMFAKRNRAEAEDAEYMQAVEAGDMEKASDMLVHSDNFKKWFGDWENKKRANAIAELNAEQLVPMPSDKTPKEVFGSLRKGKNKADGTEVSFFVSAYKKVAKVGGISEKIIATLPNIFDNSILAYKEYDNLGGIARPDGTTHKAHPNTEEVRNYVGKVEVDGKDYYVRFTVNMQRNNDGVHSYFATDVDVYDANSADSLSYPNLLGARVTADGTIVDTKLENFFRSANNSSKIVDGDGKPLVVYHGTPDGRFDVFDSSKGNSDSYHIPGAAVFSNSKRIAEGYQHNFGDEPTEQDWKDAEEYVKNETEPMLSYWDGHRWIPVETIPEIILTAKGTLRKGFLIDARRIKKGEDAWHKRQLDGAAFMTGPGMKVDVNEMLNKAFRKTVATCAREFAKGQHAGVKAAFLDIKNPLVIDYKGEIFHGYEPDGIPSIFDAVKLAKDKGYDGVIARNIKDSHSSYFDEIADDFIAFYPNQIKSADPVTYDEDGNVIPLSERFNEDNPSILFAKANRTQNGFVSNAGKAVERIKMDKATPAQWKAMIAKEGGMKAAEDKWLGLSQWLDESTAKTITKDEVMNFINENAVQIEEVKYGKLDIKNGVHGLDKLTDDYQRFMNRATYEDEDPDGYAYEKMLEKYGNRVWDVFTVNGRDEIEVQWDAFDRESDFIPVLSEYGVTLESGAIPINATRLEYTTDGLDNKREIALTVPTIEPWNEHDNIHFGDAGEGRAVAWVRFGDTKLYPANINELREAALIELNEYKRSLGLNGMISSSERVDIENSLSLEQLEKLRELDDKAKHKYVGANPTARVLFIDEIQSKRHQEGREKGYAQSLDNAKVGEFYEEERYGYDMADIVAPNGRTIAHIYKTKDGKYYGESMDGSQMTSDRDTIDDVMKGLKSFASFNGIPDAPFEKNWYELAFKRMLRLAAEEGYDKVAWTTGETQAERYNIGNLIDFLYVDKRPEENDRFVMVKPLYGDFFEYGFDKDGIITYNSVDGENSRGKKLGDVFGKGLAEEIMSSENGNNINLHGSERIGDEGMKGFYDQMLPAFVNKYGKKWGVQVEDIELPEIEQTAHSIDVTPEMRQSVMEDQVMFAKGPKDTNYVQDEEAKGARLMSLTPISVKTKAIVKKDDMSTMRSAVQWFNDNVGKAKEFVKEVGKIIIDQRSIRDSLNHKYGQRKLDAITSLVDGFEDAIYLTSLPDFDNNDITNHYFAYPINYDNERCYVICRTREDSNISRLYIHEVFPESAIKSETLQTAAGKDQYRRGIALYGSILREVLGDKVSENSGASKTSGKKLLDESPDSRQRDFYDILNEASEEDRRAIVDEAMNNGLDFRKATEDVMFAKQGNIEYHTDNATMRADEARNEMVEKLRSISGKMSSLRKAASAQRQYDRETVASVVSLANSLLGEAEISELRKSEIKRLLAIVRDANGKQDISNGVEDLVDLTLNIQINNCEHTLDKMLQVRGTKVNNKGVEVQGELDIRGQRVKQAFKKAITMSPEAIVDRINSLQQDGHPESEEVLDELLALDMAQEYHNNISDSEESEADVKDSIRKAKMDRRDGKITFKEMYQRIDAANEVLRNIKIDRIDSYNNLFGMLAGNMRESIDRKRAFTEAQRQQAAKIHWLANRDRNGDDFTEQGNKNDKILNSSFVRFFLKPLATFDQMLRGFGKYAKNGEGYLWNYFMRGWTDAASKEYVAVKDKTDILDKKMREVFGLKFWSDMYSAERKLPSMSVKMWDNGKMREYSLPQGNLAYIYMVDKMDDGRMKLRNMGIMEEDVEAIAEFLDPRVKAIADWLQEDFFSSIRKDYDEVYRRMFGAAMPEVKNYVPLKILQKARIREVDVNVPEIDNNMPSTVTGSIIKRTKNTLPLDILRTDIFDLAIEHVQKMEHWAAFGEWNRDINTLLSYKTFRNWIESISGLYGSGAAVFNNFKKAAELAAGTYRPEVSKDAVDTLAVNIAKGVSAAKVSFRLYTAIKQILSYPAFLADSNMKYLAKNTVTPRSAWKWCMENLPLFEKRFKSRQLGDTRLMQTDADWKFWRNNIVRIASSVGMTPNAFVDALTIAIGTRSMYETKYNKYLQAGYDKDAADRLAKQDAVILFNETQQSSEGAFISPMQVDRTWASVALSTFRNASMGYGRKLFNAIRDAARMAEKGYKERSIEFEKKRMMEQDGINESDAGEGAKRNYDSRRWYDALAVAVFGFIVQSFWNDGSILPYVAAGDDDDDKKKMLEDAFVKGVLGGWAEGLTGGNVISETIFALYSSLAGEESQPVDLTLMPIASDLDNIIRKFPSDWQSAANDIVNVLAQSMTGVNPQTFTDVGVAIFDACKGDLRWTTEAALLLARIIQVPQSQLRELYIDELYMKGDEALELTIDEFADRYARYKLQREAPLTGWMYSGEEKEKRLEAYRKSFVQKANEKRETRGNELDQEFYGYVNNELKTVTTTLRELNKKYEDAKYEEDEQTALDYGQQIDDYMKSDEFQRYASVAGHAAAVNSLSDLLKKVNPKRRKEVFEAIRAHKQQLVDKINKNNEKQE